jgi:acyl dehydratase
MGDRLYWEDFRPGDVLELGSHTFTEAEIVDFARRWDPQPFHTDPEAAKRSAFGGLVASGWHTCAVGMRLMVESHVGRSASLGSPGLESIRWLAPVRPGDTVTYRRWITDARESQSRPGMGLVRSRWEAVNQRGELVMTMEGWGMFGRRGAAPGAAA